MSRLCYAQIRKYFLYNCLVISACGGCECQDRWIGKRCQCSLEDLEATGGCPEKNGQKCMDRGSCFCGSCQCDPGFFGNNCQCSTKKVSNVREHLNVKLQSHRHVSTLLISRFRREAVGNRALATVCPSAKTTKARAPRACATKGGTARPATARK